QFGHCALVLYSFCHLLWSLPFNYRYCLILFCCAMILLAQSEAHISPAAIIITSFITNLPAPDKYGNPNCGVAKSLPRSGTYTSGVVNRNVKVTKDIPNVSTPPNIPILVYQIPRNVSRPIITITVPKP